MGGFARLRTLRRHLEAEGGPVLLLHAGDFLYPSVMGKYLAAEPMVRVMNLLDGDESAFDPHMVVTFGNHEFDNPDPGLILGRIAQSDFTWLSSNVRYRTAKTTLPESWEPRVPVQTHLLREINGVRVGLFSLTLDVTGQDYVDIQYSPDARRHVASEAIRQLKQQGAEIIVALTHQDLEQDEWLAREFPEIALIAGGHEHFFIKERIGATWITKADADIQSAVVHDITLRPGSGSPPTLQSRRVALDASIEKDPQVQAAVDNFSNDLARSIRKATGRDSQAIVAQTIHLLEGEETAIRSRETALGNFLADAIRQRMRTDVAFINSGGIRINDNIPPGPVTVSDLEGIFYFDDKLVSFQITGEELLETLRHSVAKAHLGHGRFLQVSGIRFRYHRTGDARSPDYLIDPTDVWVRRAGRSNFDPLDVNAHYSSASTDFVWNSGFKDGYPLFQHGRGLSSPPRLDHGSSPGFREVIEETLARLPRHTITTQIDGRIEGPVTDP